MAELVGGVATGQLSRAVNGMTLGLLKAYQARREADWEGSLDEYDQQFQLPFSGDAGPRLLWATLYVQFNMVFVVEPNRDSSYDKPQFTYGFEKTSGDRCLMQIQVEQWAQSTLGITGATLAIGIVNPGIRKVVHTEGVLHLNFQGYGTPVSEETEQSEDY